MSIIMSNLWESWSMCGRSNGSEDPQIGHSIGSTPCTVSRTTQYISYGHVAPAVCFFLTMVMRTFRTGTLSTSLMASLKSMGDSLWVLAMAHLYLSVSVLTSTSL